MTELSSRPRTPLAVFGATMPLAGFGLNLALLTPVVVTLALKVEAVAPDTKERDLGVVLGVGAFLALVSNPLFGRLSDRTTSRLGMRRPWLVLGVLVGALGLVVVALAESVLLVGVGWCVAQIAYNAALAAHSATLPDQVPVARRGAVSGLVGITTLVSIVAGTVLTAVLPGDLARFGVPALIAVVLVGLFAGVLRDRVTPERQPLRLWRSFFFDPRRHPDFGWAWLTRFTFVFAAATGLTYLPYFLSEQLGVPTADVPGRVAVATVIAMGATVLTSVVGGFVSDRIGRRKPFVIAAALIAMVGLIVVALSGSFTQLLVGEVILGLGTGCFYAVDLALITEVLPDLDDAGKDLGVINMANALPQSLAPAVAPVFITIGGYPLLFLAGAAVGIVGALLVTRIRGVS
ncbi:MFS transporter [Cryptosporangium japonicum]|uniref:MFS transporter n=1 Tax=Cryptosporangium japonicum TaxID=80872 RepID=A0ABN0TL93_9ACTN